jgi:hypothetical protein
VNYLLLALLFCFSGYVLPQNRLGNVQQAFNSLPAEPATPELYNNLSIPISGHLQGIQVTGEGKDKNLIITGSSSKFSYAITGNYNSSKNAYKVTRLEKLMDAPLRHAGGCQIADSTIYVGIEDNIHKTSSRIVALTCSTKWKYTDIIERQGIYKRSTAGATGATSTKQGILIAVADWDSENIDFYTQNTNGRFDSAATLYFQDIKGGAYQSINLITDTSGQVFLIGFCKQGNTNRADLYLLNNYTPALVSTRYFHCTKRSGFRYGAGVYIANETLYLLCCPRKLKKHNYINVFGK